MKIYIGADHGGYQLKETLIAFVSELGYEVEDMGANSLDLEDDYPDFIIPVAEKVAKEDGSLGIIIGRSGNGEAICANKVKGVRCALCLNVEMAKKAREHNNANILSLGADYLDEDRAKEIVRAFLETDFSNDERHISRLQKITDYEMK